METRFGSQFDENVFINAFFQTRESCPRTFIQKTRTKRCEGQQTSIVEPLAPNPQIVCAELNERNILRLEVVVLILCLFIYENYLLQK